MMKLIDIHSMMTAGLIIKLMELIKRLQLQCSCLTCKTDQKTSSHSCSTLGLTLVTNLQIVKRYQFKILVFAYKSLRNDALSYISDFLVATKSSLEICQYNINNSKRYKSVRYFKRLIDTGESDEIKQFAK